MRLASLDQQPDQYNILPLFVKDLPGSEETVQGSEESPGLCGACDGAGKKMISLLVKAREGDKPKFLGTTTTPLK